MALEISNRHSAGELRAMARRERNGRVASRLLAIANALDGMSRADAARAAGMDRQTLRDWVLRYDAEGVAGLRDRPKGHPAPRLTDGELAALSNVIFRVPTPRTTASRPGRCRSSAAGSGRISARACIRPACRASCARTASRGRRRGRATPPRIQGRSSASKKGAPRGAEGGAPSPSRQADRAVVPGRGAGRTEGAALPSLVDPWAAPARPLRPTLRVDLHLWRRRAGDGAVLRSRPALRQQGDDEPLSGRVRQDHSGRRSCRHGPRRRRLARQGGARGARGDHPSRLLKNSVLDVIRGT